MVSVNFSLSRKREILLLKNKGSLMVITYGLISMKVETITNMNFLK